MNNSNPKYVLRNFIAQKAIEKAEKGDFTEVTKVFNLLTKPFEEQLELEKEYTATVPEWAEELCVTCSS